MYVSRDGVRLFHQVTGSGDRDLFLLPQCQPVSFSRQWKSQIPYLSHYSPAPPRCTIAVDEPADLGGGDCAPFPPEVLLTALAGCITNGTVINAAPFNVPIDGIEMELEAHLDAGACSGTTSPCATASRTSTTRSRSEPGPRRQGPEVQGDHRPEVARARDPGEPGEHHVQVRLQAELTNNLNRRAA